MIGVVLSVFSCKSICISAEENYELIDSIYRHYNRLYRSADIQYESKEGKSGIYADHGTCDSV